MHRDEPRSGALEDWAREVAGAHGPDLEVALRESGALVAVAGPAVVKVHPDATDEAGLATRLALAGEPALAGMLAAPLLPGPMRPPPATGADGRLATVWPRLEVLTPQAADPPWAAAATLLAALHQAAVPAYAAGLAHGGPARLGRALDRLPRMVGNGARVVLASGLALAAELASGATAASAPPCLAHGDWHLGQLGRRPGGGWLLIDLDDLGVGDPAWDLARPAGFWAAGLLADEDWAAFLSAYRAAGGPAVPPEGDPWGRLDLPSRAAIVVAATRAIHRVPADGWDDTCEALVAACLRMPRGVQAAR